MAVTKKEFFAPSSDNIHTLSGVIYYPDAEPKGYFHVVHGMTEHIERYEKTMRALAEEGYICFGYDNLGHGKTAKNESELGFIAKKKGYDLLAKDVKIFSDAVIAECAKELPYILMGHSMGSFIVRYAAEKYVRPARLIVMGTGAANPAADAGLMLISIVKFFRGDKYRSRLMQKLAFGSYNNRFKNELSVAPSPWLTTDVAIRQKYSADKYCSFKFGVSAMGDLIRLMKYSNRPAWFKNVDKELPILLVSGEEDPVGDYGKGILAVEKKLSSAGANVKCVLYKGARHEILNDFCYEDVKRDILEFCNI